MLLVFVTSTLFHLARRMATPLPVGYVEPVEAVIVAVIARFALTAGPTSFTNRFNALGFATADRVLISAMFPYAAWQFACASLGVVAWAGTDHARFALRFIISGLLPLVIPLLLLRTDQYGRAVFRAAIWIALITALVHTGIQLGDYRPVMQSAYVSVSDNNEYAFVAQSKFRSIQRAEFVRLLPQGATLICLLAIYTLVQFIVSRSRRRWQLVTGGILSAALLVTVTRSLLFTLLAGLGVGVALAWGCGFLRRAAIARGAIALALLSGAAGAYDYARPGFLQYWSSRVELLSGSDSQIFSGENEARGRDNLASISAIMDHPLLGVGTPRYPAEYSLRHGPATDIHPLLQIGLVGGIPGILFALRMHFVLVAAIVRKMAADPGTRRSLIPLTAVLVTNAFVFNAIGAGGTITGSDLVASMLFTAEAVRVAFVPAPAAFLVRRRCWPSLQFIRPVRAQMRPCE
jgi:hypothetical protein